MARLEPKPTKALLKHLGRAEISRCPEHKWASARELPGKKSIFLSLSEQGKPAEEDVSSQSSVQPLKHAKEDLMLRLEPVLEYISSCELNNSKQVEALELQGFSGLDSGVPKTHAVETDQVVDASQKQSPENTPLETTDLSTGCGDASPDRNQVQEERSELDFTESQVMARGRDTEAHAKPPGLVRDSMSHLPRKSHSSSKINSKGSVAGGAGKQKKKGKTGTQPGEQLLYQIPNNKIITTKIGLLLNLREYDRVMRKISRTTKMLRMEEFFPETFRLDTKGEREIFFEIYREPHIWICKPTSSNQGRGIFLLKNQAEVKELEAKLHSMEEDPQYKKLPYKTTPARIVQRYIDRPLLLEGKKFDVRSYLLIACTVPYMLFFGHGYVRLTCLNYDPKSEDLTSHLTNQYVQKKSPMYSHVKEETVWQMERFNNYVNERFSCIKGLPKDWVFNGFTKRMKEIMLQCFLAVKSKLDCKLGYFDLIGCDFLIDEDFKVWLLEMNANPALHTNCGALKNIIPTVVNETLDLTIEIFTKIQKSQTLLPLESLCHFALLYNGMVSDHGLLPLTKSRTSLRSLRSHRTQSDNSNVGSSGNSTTTSRLMDKQPANTQEKLFKGEPKAEPSGPPEGISLLPSKGVPRNTLPMPQIQISIIPNLTCCPSVKAILRGNQVCNSGNQYVIKNVPSSSDKHHKPENSNDKGKVGAVSGGNSKDNSYATWFQQTFGTKFQPAGGNGTGSPLTSSQMVSLHLQSNLPPNLPVFQDISKPLRHLATHTNPLAAGSKVVASAGSRNSEELIPEEKISHRSS